jgi:hypothetical protein
MVVGSTGEIEAREAGGMGGATAPARAPAPRSRPRAAAITGSGAVRIGAGIVARASTAQAFSRVLISSNRDAVERGTRPPIDVRGGAARRTWPPRGRRDPATFPAAAAVERRTLRARSREHRGRASDSRRIARLSNARAALPSERTRHGKNRPSPTVNRDVTIP